MNHPARNGSAHLHPFFPPNDQRTADRYSSCATQQFGLTKKFLCPLEEAFAQRAVVFTAELGEFFQFLALFAV